MTISGMIFRGSESSSKIGWDHRPVFISIICEVLASVYSPTALPQRKYVNRSAMNSSRSVLASAGEFASRIARTW